MTMLADPVVILMRIYSIASKNYESCTVGNDDVAFQGQEFGLDQLL
jgi:hypothetical protein